jgi:hypothetical protein
VTILTDDALEFAKEHISKYYDSDFFPKSDEFEAIWHNWEEIKKHLMAMNIQKFWVSPPRVMTAKKPKGGFRVVHQLEPLDSLAYTALASQVASAVEAARVPADQNVACSYRLHLQDGSFFSGGTGYAGFVRKTEELATKFDFILETDISDYYNQIYLHRLSNAIEFADVELKAIGDDIEWFITALNSKPSQGIPVGPAASIVMAEAILIDIDQFLQNKGFSHTRYVDDFRIFGESERALRKVLEELTLYLYENHRLTLAGDKTDIIEAESYINQQLHNQYAEERMRVFKSLEIFNPYTEEVEEIEFEVDDEEELLRERVIAVIDKVVNYKTLDLGLARSAIRKAKWHSVPDIAPRLIQHFAFFAPVISDVMLYFDEITDEEFSKAWAERFAGLVCDEVLDNELVRYWIEWYWSKYAGYLNRPEIRNHIAGSSFIDNQARAAITTRNLAWVRDKKTEIIHLGSWERRAVLNAARVLPSDERRHWLQMTIAHSPILIDRWVAKWVLDTA